MTRWFLSVCAIGSYQLFLIGTAQAQRLKLTVILTIQQFLTDRANGARTTIGGELRIPKQGIDRASCRHSDAWCYRHRPVERTIGRQSTASG